MTEFQRFVVSLIVERQEDVGASVLLQRRRSSDEFDGLLELPQGRVERGEVIYRAAARELKEETGLELISLSGHDGEPIASDVSGQALNPIACVIDEVHNYAGVVFVATARGDAHDTAEASGHAWRSVDDLRSLVVSGRLFPLNVPMISAYLRWRERT